MVGRNIQEPEINGCCSLTDQNNVRPVCQNKTLDGGLMTGRWCVKSCDRKPPNHVKLEGAL